MGKTATTAEPSLILQFVITWEFARPNYKKLCQIAALSTIFYVLSPWLFEFSACENRLLQDALWPHWLLNVPRSAGPSSD
jgi:hypothetical protein